MEEVLTHEFIAANLEEMIVDFDYVDIEDIGELTEFLLAIWVLLGIDDSGDIDEDANLIPGSVLFCLNDDIYDALVSDDKLKFVEIIRHQLIISEKYEVLSLMPSLMK